MKALKAPKTFHYALTAACALVLATQTAQAQSTGSSTATTQGDVTTTVFNPQLVFGDGTIEISSLNLRAEAGALHTEGGERAMRARLSLGHPIYIFGSKGRDGRDMDTAGVFKLNAGGSATLDFNGKEVRRLDLESPSLAFVAYNNKFYTTEELDRLSRTRFVGKDFRDLAYEDQNRIIEQAKPTFTASINLTEATYRYIEDKGIGGRFSGVEITAGNFDLHKAFTVTGLPMDFCMYARPIGIAVGETRIQDKTDKAPRVVSSFGGCLGAQIPYVGELKGTFDFRVMNKAEELDEEGYRTNGVWVVKTPGIDYDDLRMTEMKISADINKVFGTPIGVGYEYSIASAQSGGPDSTTQTEHRHFLKAKVAF